MIFKLISKDELVNLFKSKINNDTNVLKMLGLYLYTLIIIHKSSNMLRILNKLTLYIRNCKLL